MGVKNQSRSAHRKATPKSAKGTFVREAVKIPCKPEHVSVEQIKAAIRKLDTV